MSNDILKNQIAAIEEAYEYFLAFAAQGVRDDRAGGSGGELRSYLARMDDALAGVVTSFRDVVARDTALHEQFTAMIQVLEHDVAAARAAIRLVMSRPAISSQLVDNLNASIHVRALLTDLFLMDEALPRPAES